MLSKFHRDVVSFVSHFAIQTVVLKEIYSPLGAHFLLQFESLLQWPAYSETMFSDRWTAVLLEGHDVSAQLRDTFSFVSTESMSLILQQQGDLLDLEKCLSVSYLFNKYPSQFIVESTTFGNFCWNGDQHGVLGSKAVALHTTSEFAVAAIANAILPPMRLNTQAYSFLRWKDNWKDAAKAFLSHDSVAMNTVAGKDQESYVRLETEEALMSYLEVVNRTVTMDAFSVYDFLLRYSPNFPSDPKKAAEQWRMNPMMSMPSNGESEAANVKFCAVGRCYKGLLAEEGADTDALRHIALSGPVDFSALGLQPQFSPTSHNHHNLPYGSPCTVVRPPFFALPLIDSGLHCHQSECTFRNGGIFVCCPLTDNDDVPWKNIVLLYNFSKKIDEEDAQLRLLASTKCVLAQLVRDYFDLFKKMVDGSSNDTALVSCASQSLSAIILRSRTNEFVTEALRLLGIGVERSDLTEDSLSRIIFQQIFQSSQ